MNMFARFNENPAMTLQDIKETKRYGRTHGRTDARTDGRTDGQRENSIPPTNKVCGGYNKLMYSDCRGRLQHKWLFGFVQNAEKIVQVAHIFLTETSSSENKATVYLIFLPTCLQELKRCHHLIFIHGTLPLT